MKNVFVPAFLFSLASGYAQLFSPVVQSVIDAENKFAAAAKEKNTRDAFIEHLADSAIVFLQGRPVLGQPVWAKRQADSSLLCWWPVFSDISAAGDMAYNTGPFEWSKDRSGAEPVGFGYFSSVWKKDKQGVWKVVIDIGTSLPAKEANRPALTTSTRQPLQAKGNLSFAQARKEFLTTDRTYIEKLNRKSVSLIVSFFSKEARLHHTGNFPVITPQAIRNFSDSRENYQFEQSGGDVAMSGDLAYAYGKVKAINKADKKEVSLNYMRIWKKEDGKKWKIVLDVIGG